MRPMLSRHFFSLMAVIALAALLPACGSLRRDDMAAKAKTQMIGMAKEDVLACMGIPKKKMTEGAVEVWSYLSTNGYGYSYGSKARITGGNSLYGSEHEKRFCTVNVVMKNGFVTALHYLGPTATYAYNTLDQCGYAVAACVNTAD
jgi:hypothetical protein